MKKLLIYFLLSIFSITSYSQIIFEKGHYIDNTNTKHEGFIKNYDWKSNPKEIEFKVSESVKPEVLPKDSVQAFEVYNESKYIRFKVNIDRSSENLDRMSHERNPNFKEEQLFLRVLVEGEANLYQYEDGNLYRFFYEKEISKIEQLVFKSYKTSENKIGQNNAFRQQLWQNLDCSSSSKNKINFLKYKKKELVNFFVEYNRCKNNDLKNFEEKEKRDLFNLTIRPRLNFSSLMVQNSKISSRDTEFGMESDLSLGIEGEVILPFNKNKWSVILEPTYQYYKAENIVETEVVSGGKLITTIDYKSIEFPIGFRHYFFLNQNSKMFFNASYIFDVSFDSTLEFKRVDGSNFNSLEIKARNNYAFGLGYKQNDKYSLEFRYHSSRRVLGNYLYWDSSYNTFSIIFGYSLF